MTLKQRIEKNSGVIKMTKKLTHKQERFVQEYLIDLNATQAAIRAGYSKKTANNQVGVLLVNVGIQSAIQVAMEERSKRAEINSDDVAYSGPT